MQEVTTTTAPDMKHGKIYDQFINFVIQTEDFRCFIADLDTRERYYVLNCKVHAWIKDDQIDIICKKLNLTPREIIAVKEEFTEDRIYGIQDHCNEREIEYFKDYMGNCAYNKDEPEYKIIDLFDQKNVYQFGRSGGWISFAQCGDFDFTENDEHGDIFDCIEAARKETRNNADFYAHILENQYYTNCRNVKELLTTIREFTAQMDLYIKAINFVGDQVKATVKGMQEVYNEQLEQEISDFVANGMFVEERLQQGLAKIDHILKIEGEEVTTTQHAKANIKEIATLIRSFENGENITGQFVGGYKITDHYEVNREHYFKVGCHLLQFSDIKASLNII